MKVNQHLPMAIKRAVPTSAGSNLESNYIIGHNPRRSKFSTSPGVGGTVATPKIPHKTDLHLFPMPKFGYPNGKT